MSVCAFWMRLKDYWSATQPKLQLLEETAPSLNQNEVKLNACCTKAFT